MPSLADQFCPNLHDRPLTAAAYDAESGALATADESGMVALQRAGESTPNLVFQHGSAPPRALGLIRGGTQLAVGDDQGSVAVYRTDTGDVLFEEERQGARGRVRAMRGIALSPDGARLAAIAIDGLLRVWELTRNERNAWRGFSGNTVEFDPRGQRLLAMDDQGQPRLMDLASIQALYMDRLQTPAQFARFSRDGTSIVAAGQSGISLLRVVDGALIASFATKGGSGIINLLLSPDGAQTAAITQRSVHVFSLPSLDPADSYRHGAPKPTGAAVWTSSGVRVAGSSGVLHGRTASGSSLGPVNAASGLGRYRLAVHGSEVALWSGNQRQRTLEVGTTVRRALVDRDGRLLLVIPDHGPVAVYEWQSGKRVFDCGPETSGTPDAQVGGTVVAAALRSGGCRWWDLGANRAFELKWPQAMALSGGGTWLAVVTPKGAVKILDPSSGGDAAPGPRPLAEVPVKLLSFVNRRPDLLILDNDGVLGHYDLTDSLKTGQPAEGRDVITINVPVDQLWGITGGQHCAVRLDEGDSSSILFVDVHACEVVHEVSGLSRDAWVDSERGLIVEPARGGGVLERDMQGAEVRVLRSLPGGQWLSYGWNGILEASAEAAKAI